MVIDTQASHAILIDSDTGAVLLEKSADEHMPTSSMSKTMTMYMVFEALKEGRLHLDDELMVSEKAWRMQGSKMFIKVGDKVKVEDLIRGVLIQSGNDAGGRALAEGIAGSEDAFADAMNTKAHQQLGMKNSHFMNASGWPVDNHYSTARDLALLADHLIRDFPEYYDYFGEKDFTYNHIHQENRDPLLSHLPGADGLKTGHTDIAGFGLIGSAKRGDRRLILVMNGLPDIKAREDEGVRLLEWGFRNFEEKTFVKKGDVVDTAKVWLGRQDEVPLIASQDLKTVLPVSRVAETKFSISYMGPLKAPIAKGDAVAKLRVNIPGQAPVEMDLLAGEDVQRLGALARAKGAAGVSAVGEG